MKCLPTYVKLAVLAVLGVSFASQALAVTPSGNCVQFLNRPLPATIAGLSFAVAGVQLCLLLHSVGLNSHKIQLPSALGQGTRL
jgi:hypothetical protein